MKLVYRDENIVSEAEALSKELGFELERRETLDELVQSFKVANRGKAVGAPIPEAFVDLGKYLAVFFVEIVVGGIAWDFLKPRIVRFISNVRGKTRDTYKSFALSDGGDPNQFESNIYFFIPVDLSEDELATALDKAHRIIGLISKLREESKIAGSLRFSYSGGGFTLRQLAISS